FGKDEQVLQIMDRLAGMYSDSGRRQAAEFLYRELLETNPTAEKAFDYQLHIVQGYSASGDGNTFKKELFRWVEEYGPDSRWYLANKGNSELVKRAEETREKTLRNYILQLHKEAQKSRSPVTQKIAKEGYQVYLRNFSASPLRGEMHFYFGELLYDMGDYEQAGTNYVWVVENAPKSRFHEDAILNSIIAVERTLTPEAELRNKIGKSQDRFPFGPNEERFAVAVARYVKIYPNSDRAVDARFKLGRIHYIHNQFAEATTIFQAIVKDYPKSKVASFSANLILDIFNIQKDYDSMARVGQEFLKNPHLKGQLDVDVEGIVERASFKKGTDLELEKDYMGAATEFEKFYQNNPKSKLVTSAAFNAGVNFERAGIVSKSLKLYERVLQSKEPESQALRLKARQLQARLYEKTGQYEKAAAEFEAFATENPKDPLSPDLWYNVAVIYDGLRKSQKAIRSYEKFYETSKKASKTEAIFRIGEIYERMEKWLTASKYYERYLEDGGRDPNKIIEVHLKLGQLHKRMGKVDEADVWFKKTLAYQRRMSKAEGRGGADQAAEARFELASRQLATFKQMRIPRNPAEQQKVLKQKLNFLNQLNSEFLEVIKFDDAEFVVASLNSLGSAYEHMTQAILGTPVPPGLNAEQTKAYKEELEKFVGPIRQKAVENYKGAIDKGYEFQVYNSQLAAAQNAMSRLSPEPSDVSGRDFLPI
ncbi:MAG: tetratricopeptide repeat protein, partial [Bdellovibrionales bacterium]|nr:tetratricopeptide repeat protein [Bdellovibrionales bacterium]